MKVKYDGKVYRECRQLSYAPETNIAGSEIPINQFSIDIKTTDVFTTDHLISLWTDAGVRICQFYVTDCAKIDDNWQRITAQDGFSKRDKRIVGEKFYNDVYATTVARDCGWDYNYIYGMITGYCPEQTARERMQWLSIVTGQIPYDFSNWGWHSYGGKTWTINADEVFYQPNYVNKRNPVKIRLTTYDYREGTPTTTDKWVSYNGHYYIETTQAIEFGSSAADANTVNISDCRFVNSSNVNQIASRLTNIYFAQGELTADVLMHEMDGERFIEPGDRVRVSYREDKMYSGICDKISYSYQGGRTKASIHLVGTTSVSMGRLTVISEYKVPGQSYTNTRQSYYFPLSFAYKVEMPDIIKTDNNLVFHFIPEIREISGTMTGSTQVIVRYDLDRMDGDELSDIFSLADRGQYPRKFVENVDNARKGRPSSRTLLALVGITDYDASYYSLLQDAMSVYEQMPDGEQKYYIYTNLFSGGYVWAVSGGTWLEGQENYWEFDENGNLRFPSEFDNTYNRAKLGDRDALEAFWHLGIMTNDLHTKTKDEIYRMWKEGYLNWINSGYDDDVIDVFARVGVNPYDLSDEQRRFRWDVAFTDSTTYDIRIYSRMGYDDLSGLSDDELNEIWWGAYGEFVDLDNRTDYSSMFFDKWTKKSNAKNIVDATEITVEYNGYYEAPVAFRKVTANPKPRLGSRKIKANGYYFTEGDIDGYDKVVVDIQKSEWMRDLVITRGGEYEPEEPYEAYNQVNVNLPVSYDYKYKFGDRIYKGQIARVFSNGTDIYTLEVRYTEDSEHNPVTVYCPIYKNGEYFCDFMPELPCDDENDDRWVTAVFVSRAFLYSAYGRDYLMFLAWDRTATDPYFCYSLLSEGSELLSISKKRNLSEVQAILPDYSQVPEYYLNVISFAFGVHNNRPVVYGGGTKAEYSGNTAILAIAYLDDLTYELVEFAEHANLNLLSSADRREAWLRSQLGKTEFACVITDLIDGQTVDKIILLRDDGAEVTEGIELTDFYNEHWLGVGLYKLGEDYYAATLIPSENETIMYGDYEMRLYKYIEGQFVDMGALPFSTFTGLIDLTFINEQMYGVITSSAMTATGRGDEEYPLYAPMIRADGLYQIRNEPIPRYEVN